jgi:small GTP-binding protein
MKKLAVRGSPSRPEKEAKIVMVGSATVGKTSIVNRFAEGLFNSSTQPTIGAAFLALIVRTPRYLVKLQIWDTAGCERYRAMAAMYFQNAHGAIIVYDVTSLQSFNDVETWLAELREHGDRKIAIALVGNKTDLVHERAVAPEAGRQYALDNGIDVFKETSAANGANISDIFTELVLHMELGELDEGQQTSLEEIPKQESCC